MNPIKAINRTVEVKVRINCNQGVKVSFIDPLEISLDCLICLALRRTVMITTSSETTVKTPRNDIVQLTAEEKPAICTPTLHTFPGRVLEKQATETQEGWPAIVFRVGYLFGAFVDRKYGKEATELPKPVWARVHFLITCPQCERTVTEATQTNLVRPWTMYCKCGYELFTDDMPPVFQNLQVVDEAAN